MQSRWKRTFQVEEWLNEQRQKRILCMKENDFARAIGIAWKACFGKSLGKKGWKALTGGRN